MSGFRAGGWLQGRAVGTLGGLPGAAGSSRGDFSFLSLLLCHPGLWVKLREAPPPQSS